MSDRPTPETYNLAPWPNETGYDATPTLRCGWCNGVGNMKPLPREYEEGSLEPGFLPPAVICQRCNGSGLDPDCTKEEIGKGVRLSERERDEAREALMKIEEIFVDGCDTCADREKMGLIARAALEGAIGGRKMSERSTPETDAITSVGLENADRECVPADFARKLEQERDEARVAIRALAEHGESEIQRITKERDEARESLENARELNKWLTVFLEHIRDNADIRYGKHRGLLAFSDLREEASRKWKEATK